jgi:hypothetical protein
MAKRSNKNADGTSFHGVTIRTTAIQLKHKFGQPDGGEEDKVNWDWTLETEDGTIFTVYDWKEGRHVTSDTLIDFHIGARNFMDSVKAQEELQQDLEA